MSNILRIIFAGTPVFSAQYLKILLHSNYRVVGVLTQMDKPSGRGYKITASPVKILAQNNKLPVLQVSSLEKIEKFISDTNANIIVVVSCGIIFTRKILDMLTFGCINVHFSLLPRWRGSSPVQYSILAGDSKTGVSIIQMNAGIDTGNILNKVSCQITNNDTSGTLYNKLTDLGLQILIKTLQQIINGHVQSEKQNDTLATYAPKLNKEKARINWLYPAEYIIRCVRAFNPWPVSWMRIDDKLIKVWKASVIKRDNLQSSPGTIIDFNKNGIQIATTSNIVNLESLQLSSKKITDTKNLINVFNYLLKPGKCLI